MCAHIKSFTDRSSRWSTYSDRHLLRLSKMVSVAAQASCKIIVLHFPQILPQFHNARASLDSLSTITRANSYRLICSAVGITSMQTMSKAFLKVSGSLSQRLHTYSQVHRTHRPRTTYPTQCSIMHRQWWMLLATAASLRQWSYTKSLIFRKAS